MGRVSLHGFKIDFVGSPVSWSAAYFFVIFFINQLQSLLRYFWYESLLQNGDKYNVYLFEKNHDGLTRSWIFDGSNSVTVDSFSPRIHGLYKIRAKTHVTVYYGWAENLNDSLNVVVKNVYKIILRKSYLLSGLRTNRLNWIEMRFWSKFAFDFFQISSPTEQNVNNKYFTLKYCKKQSPINPKPTKWNGVQRFRRFMLNFEYHNSFYKRTKNKFLCFIFEYKLVYGNRASKMDFFWCQGIFLQDFWFRRWL